ncbi:UDP-N-acetylglucosamine 1-carboxyvinyltransferase [bacterium]|nr:UDP-N-acetylglucosamine 1-carboxyvinyltransferase [bacterium]|tara:strand:+ start:2628 stop:3899 length:1272 start_codon:yes stop_codon:yes gene_type:complete
MGAHFIVQGGKSLKGTIHVNGAKNAVLKSLAATILFEDTVRIENVPLIEDVFRAVELLEDLGIEVERKNRTIKIKTKNLHKTNLDINIARSLRASIVMIGPILAREKKAFFPHPGGCVIGKRPINLFLEGWKCMGAECRETKRGYTLKAKKLKGCEFIFRNISVTGTETLMMTAVLAEGTTTLRNAACEPEITALAEFLNRCGAHIEGAGTHTIKITGTGGKLLQTRRKAIKTIPDRIEAGSFLALGALLGRPLKVTGCDPEHLSVPLQILQEAGVPIRKGKDWIQVSKSRKLKSLDLKTREYPGLPTDLQSLFVILMTQAEGQSMVHETVFEGRLNYIEELNRMGARITMCDPHRALIHGPTRLRAREIESTDIRAGLAFLIGAMIAKGESRVNNIYQIDRGYEHIEERLIKLGAQIQRIES